jgi:hypothetical protein
VTSAVEAASVSASSPELEASVDGAQAAKDGPFDRRSVPSECAPGSELCQPSRDFVSRLCSGKSPSVALAMFGAETPWKRAYVRMREIQAINTAGGPSGEENLVFDEEVIVLNRRAPSKTAMAVSGSDGYLVLRWDGTCATVQSEEMTDHVPPKPMHAPIAFNYLDDDQQTALLADAKIRGLRRAQRESCGGRALSPSEVCRNANRKLGDGVVAAVHRGLALPEVAATNDGERGVGVASR